ncbi:MAG: tetratricopeptide repeat protein, partial [Verrucomicrobiales bacterium]
SPAPKNPDDSPAAAKRTPQTGTNLEDEKVEIARMTRKASASFEHKDYHKAEALYEDILKSDRQNTYNLCNLGIIKLRLAKHDEAEVLFNKALAYDPNHSPSHFMLGVLYFNAKNYDGALESIGHAVALRPGNARAHQYLGLIASHKGWIERAEQEFKKAISIDPEFAEAHFNLSILYATSENPTRELAQKYYQEALSLGAKPDPVMEEFLKG